MLSNLKTWFTKKKPVIRLGGQIVAVEPMNLERTLQIVLILSPYIALLEQYWPEFVGNLQGKRKPKVLTALVRTMADEMRQAPGDMVKMAAILADRDVEWMARNATAPEIVRALPVWDEVNDFGLLVSSVKALGLQING